MVRKSTARDAPKRLELGYVITEDAQLRLNQLAKATEALADIAESVDPNSKSVDVEHFGPILRVFGFMASDIAKSAAFSPDLSPDTAH